MAELENDASQQAEVEALAGPQLLASSDWLYNCSIPESYLIERALQGVAAHQPRHGDRDANALLERSSNYFTSAQWSADGTCLITTNADHSIRTFVVPVDLLEPREKTHSLQPYSIIPSSEPISAIAPYPFFSLGDSSTSLILSSVRDLPLRLSNIHHPEHLPGLVVKEQLQDNPNIPTSTIVTSYDLITLTTERYLTPASLIWSSDGSHFYTGTDSLICIFDVNQRTPLVRLPTIPSKRHKSKGGGVGIRGIVSSLKIQPNASGQGQGVLAAGTWTRCVGLYDAEGMGGTVATWDIRHAADNEAGIGGMGVSQVTWSPCGQYLLVAERRSRGVLVYDVRVSHKMVGWLEGRAADTNQRMGIDVFQQSPDPTGVTGGCEVWAGGTDGMISVWKNVGQREGAHPPDWQYTAHQDPVSSVIVHPSGTVVASCSGQRRLRSSLNAHEGSSESVSGDDSASESEPGSETDSGSNDTNSESDSEIETDDSSSKSQQQSLLSAEDDSRDNSVGDNSLKIWNLI